MDDGGDEELWKRRVTEFAPFHAAMERNFFAKLDEAMQQPIDIGYTNWRGEYAVRKITPLHLWFGTTEWHPEPQWLIKAFDHDKQAERDFALTGFGAHAP